MKTCPKVLIIIVTWDKKEYVLQLLKSLSLIDYIDEHMDIVVVDNNSQDGTVKAIRENYPDIHLIENSDNLGGTGGFNTGLSFAFDQAQDHYDYLWLLDNDVVVHKNALKELVSILETEADIAIAGSTMMQLDYPCRINEMGAFVDRYRGELVLNRHLTEIVEWRGMPVEKLSIMECDLSQHVEYCHPILDVDYVAAASLLIRAPVAHEAGLWKDFFIHFDDVEWCLRIGKMGHRVVVSARSLIWHLSAAAKIPTWVLYYDNRNALYMMAEHGVSDAVPATIRWSCKKAIHYALVGQSDLASLHLQAVNDFQKGVTGKKNIRLKGTYHSITEAELTFADKQIKKVLIPWNVNLQASSLQPILVKAMKRRPDLKITYIVPPRKELGSIQQLPGSQPFLVSKLSLIRWWKIGMLYNQYDLVLQSDYKPIKLLSWIATENMFVSEDGFCRRQREGWKTLVGICTRAMTLWTKTFLKD